MLHRGDLTDEQWERLRPLLPPQKPLGKGRPAKSHRQMINGMLWICRTGAPWRDLPPRYGKVQGVLLPLSTLAREWSVGTGLCYPAKRCRGRRAHRLATALCGFDDCSRPSARRWRKRGDPQQEALGRSQGGFSTKIHLRAEGEGKPLVFVLTPGQCGEAPQLQRLMEAGAVRPLMRPGRPRLRPRALAGDKAYTGVATRALLRRRHIRAVVPRRRNERSDGRHRFDRETYRKRNHVERLISRLKQFRRVATRYEKRAANYLAMLTLAAITLWF